MEPIGDGTIGRSVHAQSEQGVYGQIKCFGRILRKSYAGLEGPLPSSFGVIGCVLFVSQPCDDHLFAPMMEVNRGFKSIATVVARAAGDPNFLCMRGNGQGQLGCRKTRTFHQGVFR